ncbi:MAG: hypothetical protein P4L34_09180 [Paludibacter sp.]|nr:hypothetical protein [Paludibacter sp.]
MMDFISIPLVVGIITFGIYRLFDLFVRKKERLAIIEKIGDKFEASMIGNKFSFPFISQSPGTFGTLKVACLLLGVGLGLLVGYFICLNSVTGYNTMQLQNNAYEISGVVYGASVLLFGGLGLLCAFLIEMRFLKNNKD